MANKVYIIANGSNDLYYSISQSLNKLILSSRRLNRYEFNIFYNMIKPIGIDIFIEKGEESYFHDGTGCINYKNGILKKSSSSDFFKEITVGGKVIKIMMPQRYLKNVLNDRDLNIVILSGHGGLFQSFLDMSISPAYSLNTVNLLKQIKDLKIDLLYLDMCAVNYIEVIYEILENSSVKNLITYKNIAPFTGISYIELLEYIDKFERIECGIENFINNSNIPIVYFSQNDVEVLNQVKKDLNAIASDYFIENKIDLKKKFINIIKKISLIGYNKNILLGNNHLNINFLNGKLKDMQERVIYKEYSFSKDNLWADFVIDKISMEDCTRIYSNVDVLRLEKESLRHIIWLHNSCLSEKGIEKILERFIKIRHEEDYY